MKRGEQPCEIVKPPLARCATRDYLLSECLSRSVDVSYPGFSKTPYGEFVRLPVSSKPILIYLLDGTCADRNERMYSPPTSGDVNARPGILPEGIISSRFLNTRLLPSQPDGERKKLMLLLLLTYIITFIPNRYISFTIKLSCYTVILYKFLKKDE